MPSSAPLPTIADYLDAHRRAIVGRRGALLDVREGSGFEMPGGVNAVLMTRQARRDQRLFGNAYTDTAQGPDLDRHLVLKYKAPRIEATHGQGTAILARPAAGAGGTFYRGTRIEVIHPSTALPPAEYRVAADTLVAASDTVVNVPVEAVQLGAGVAIATQQNLRLGDQLFDTTFAVLALTCADGTDEELDDVYRARARARYLVTRPGYEASIAQACADAGAAQVVLLSASSLGPAADAGLSFLYVADASWVTTPALLQACTVAVDAWRVAGCDLQVCGMARQSLSLAVAVSLWDDPSNFNLVALRELVAVVLLDQFNGSTNWWTFRLNALAGAIQAVASAIQSVVITATPGEPAVAFTPVLPRYVLSTLSITFAEGT